MDEEFAPVDLVSPNGRPWTARTPAELINLTGKGYRPDTEGALSSASVRASIVAGGDYIRDTCGASDPAAFDYDKGGVFPSVATLAVNESGEPEPVISPPDWPPAT